MKIPIAEIEQRALQLHDRIVGMPPEFQSAVIAHLLATWIAGHRRVSNSPNEWDTDLAQFRETLLQNHIELVRQLIPVEDARLDEGGKNATTAQS
jgi:hypothetical protein